MHSADGGSDDGCRTVPSGLPTGILSFAREHKKERILLGFPVQNMYLYILKKQTRHLEKTSKR